MQHSSGGHQEQASTDPTRLFTQNLHDEFTHSGASIEIYHHDLLPRAEQKRTGRKRNGDGRSLELPAKMAVAVVLSRIDRVVLPLGSGGTRRSQNVFVSSRIPGSSSIIMTEAVVCLTNTVTIPAVEMGVRPRHRQRMS